MKKIGISLLIVLSLLAALAACSSPGNALSDETEEASSPDGSFDLETAGVSFDLPEEWQDTRGVFQPGYGVEIDPGSGIYLSALTYCAMTEQKYNELVEKGGDLTEEDVAFIQPRMIDCVLVYTIDGGRTQEDLTAALEAYGLPAEGCKELGSAGEYSFFCVVDPFADILDSEFAFDEGFREEYDAILEACDDLSWIRVYEPEEVPKAQVGSALAFETTDLEGNAVRSEDIFSENRLTMVNLWGTFCGPCIGEMPDLEELNARLKDKDCAVIGVVIDVPSADDSAMIQTAEEIIADTGVTYLNLLPWEGMDAALPSQFVPTTYFIDANGQIVGEAAIGARGADEYEALIDEVLASMER